MTQHLRIFNVLVGLTLLLTCLAGCADPTPSMEPVPALTTQTPQPDDNATTGAIARSTRQAQETANAQATLNAEKTAEAQASQTAWVQINATRTVVARVTGEAIFAAQSGWPAIVSESFSDNSLGWLLGVTTDRSPVVTAKIAENHYQWSVVVPDAGSYINLVPDQSPTLSAFHASVSVQFVAGSPGNQTFYGLVFRRVDRSYGFFGISQTGILRMMEVHDSNIASLTQESSQFIQTASGQINCIEVIAIGPDFVFLVNDHVVGQMNAELDPGTIGLGVEASSEADQSQVWFSDFEITAPTP